MTAIQLQDPAPHLAPGTPFVRLQVGDQTVDLTDHLLRLTETRVDAEVNRAELELFDQNWSDLEDLLLPKRDEITYSYGWIWRERTIETKPRVASIVSYSPNFVGNQGNFLRLTLIERVDRGDGAKATGQVGTERVHSRVFGPLGRPQTKVDDPKGEASLRPSDIAEFMADEMGLKKNIDRAKVVRGVFQQVNETNLAFLRRILPLCTSETNDSGWYLAVRDGTLHYGPSSYVTRRSYVYGRDANGTILQFNLNVQGNIGLFGQTPEIQAVGWDPFNKKIVKETGHLLNPPPGRIAIGSQILRPTESDTPGRVYVTPLPQVDQVKNYVQSRFEGLIRSSITGSLLVMGDPEIEPLEPVRLVVTKNNGDLHYTSGYYIVRQVTNVLQPGSYTTQLDVFADGLRKADQVNKGDLKKLPQQER